MRSMSLMAGTCVSGSMMYRRNVQAASGFFSSAAVMEMWDLLCSSHNRPVRCYTPTVVSEPAP